nr:hypothetical protein [Tanacetum cinerariifolium]
MAILKLITNSQCLSNKFMQVLDQNVEEEKDDEFVSMEEVAEEQSKEIPTIEQLLDEVDKQNKAVQETSESPYDTESEIKIVKSFFISHIPGLKDQTMHDPEDIADIHEASNFDLQSMPDDDLRSAQVQKNLQDKLPNLLLKPMYKELNTFNKLESQRFALLQKKLSKSLHKDKKKSIQLKFRKGMTKVRDKLSWCTSTMANNSQHVQDLKVMFKEMVSLIEAAEVFKKANAEGEKWEKNNHADEKNAPHPDQTKGEKISGSTLLILLKRDLLKPEQQQKYLNDFTNQLFGTTSSKFSPTPLREPTHPKDPTKGKEVTIVKEQVNELVTYHEEGGFIPKMPKLKPFITPEGTLSQKELNNQIMKLKRINQAKKLGLPPPPALVTFRMTAREKKKRTEFLKEVFVTKDIKVDGMGKNLIPPFEVVPIEGLVSKEPKPGIFYMNRNTDIAFQRESEFHLTPAVQLIRIQNQIKVDSEIASEMFRTMNYVIKARDDCIEAWKTVQENLDNLG